MGMSISYTETGRIRQKQRTRDALIDAARTLIGQGHTPTVEDAAAGADISRTTAYRYFPNRRELLIAAHPEIGEHSFLPEDPPDDVHERLEIVLERSLAMTVENETALRTAFTLSLSPGGSDLVLRQGRVVGWIEDALSPLHGRLSPKQISRLAKAIRATAGIEPLIWLCDVGCLSRPEAVKLMKWSAHALLDAALKDA
jgi:AcrR family transcriptional regulator